MVRFARCSQPYQKANKCAFDNHLHELAIRGIILGPQGADSEKHAICFQFYRSSSQSAHEIPCQSWD